MGFFPCSFYKTAAERRHQRFHRKRILFHDGVGVREQFLLWASGSVEGFPSSFHKTVAERWHQRFHRKRILFHDGEDVRAADRDTYLSVVLEPIVFEMLSRRTEILHLENDQKHYVNTQWQCSPSVVLHWWAGPTERMCSTRWPMRLKFLFFNADAWGLRNTFSICCKYINTCPSIASKAVIAFHRRDWVLGDNLAISMNENSYYKLK